MQEQSTTDSGLRSYLQAGNTGRDNNSGNNEGFDNNSGNTEGTDSNPVGTGGTIQTFEHLSVYQEGGERTISSSSFSEKIIRRDFCISFCSFDESEVSKFI